MWKEKGPSGQTTHREGLFESFLMDGRRQSAIEYHDGKKNGDARFWTTDGRLCFKGRYQDDFLVKEIRYDDLERTVMDETYLVKSHSINALGPDGDSLKAKETCAWSNAKSKSPIKNGLCILTYPEGQHLSIRYYHLGRLQGPVKAWYSDGKPWMEGTYEKDIPTGIWRSWTPNGKPLWSANYSQGEKNGTVQEWFPDGKPKSKAEFKSGKRQGEYQEWYPNGKLRIRGKYKEGKREGTEAAWFPDGGRLYLTKYNQGKLNSDFYQWYPQGHLRLHCHFLDGKKEGWSRVWYRQGSLLEHAVFHEGRLNGPYRTWTQDGAPLSTKEFQNGTVASDSKAKELLELLGADQIRVPVGLLGFYWGMALKDCLANLSLLLATDVHSGDELLTAKMIAFQDHHPTQARIRLQFNGQGELWGIKLDLLQNNSSEFFSLCESLEREIGSELGIAGFRKGDANTQYYLTRKKEWGKFSITALNGTNSIKGVTQELPVVSAEGFSPGDTGWFRFTIANHLYREYVNPNNSSITPPRWPEEAFLAGR